MSLFKYYRLGRKPMTDYKQCTISYFNARLKMIIKNVAKLPIFYLSSSLWYYIFPDEMTTSTMSICCVCTRRITYWTRAIFFTTLLTLSQKSHQSGNRSWSDTSWNAKSL